MQVPGKEMLGKRVRVKLSDRVVATGVLLQWSDMGEVTLLEEDGDIHHCWPALDFEVAE